MGRCRIAKGLWPQSTVGHAPPVFIVDGKAAVPVHFYSQKIILDFDVQLKKCNGHSIVDFVLTEEGCPLLDLVPNPKLVLVNGKPVEMLEVRPPEGEAPLRMIDCILDPGKPHRLEVKYELSSTNLIFEDSAVRFGLFMSDLSMRGYLERYAPANLEFDSTPVYIQVNILGSDREHKLFSNALETKVAKLSWDLYFPEYFNCSSFYLHLTERLMVERRVNFAGIEREIPVLIYGEDSDAVDAALTVTLETLHELEGAYGSYAHTHLVVYLTRDMESGMAGMEYCGATMTTLDALGHELTHSWFARGVMPANGNAGWIDEAIASWRDDGYSSTIPRLRSPVNLAAFSPYRRHTTLEAYTLGRLFLSELDFRFQKTGGLRPILRKLYLLKRRSTLSTQFFQTFLEQQTDEDLGVVFDRYVYGHANAGLNEISHHYSDSEIISMSNEIQYFDVDIPKISKLKAPRSYTWNELRSLL